MMIAFSNFVKNYVCYASRLDGFYRRVKQTSLKIELKIVQAFADLSIHLGVGTLICVRFINIVPSKVDIRDCGYQIRIFHIKIHHLDG